MFNTPGNDSGGGPPCDHFKHAASRERLQGILTPNMPVSLGRRKKLMVRLARCLEYSATFLQSIALSILYIVAEGEPGSQAERLSTYLRWRLVFDAAADDVAKQRILREFRAEIASAQEDLKVYADLDGVEREAIDALIQFHAATRPLAEARFSDWPATDSWLAPTHAQSVLDAVIGQSGCSVVQFTLKRQACDAAAHGLCLSFGVIAAGVAANSGALCALADELRGYGRLASQEQTGNIARPTLTCFVAQNAEEHAHLYNNLINQSTQPWTTCADPLAHVALTNEEAGLLAPLPMILGHWW